VKTFTANYGEGYNEGGLLTADGPVGVVGQTEHAGESLSLTYSGWLNSDYEETAYTTTHDAELNYTYNGSKSDGWNYTYMAAGVFGPGGEYGIYQTTAGGGKYGRK
jgi:hypothetical protein